nr:uncharacterized protein YsmA-like [Nerophis lumbriciformis]
MPTSRSDFKIWEPQQVRWGDMDAFGHVNNTTYFTYCESARMRYFREAGLGELRAAPSVGPAVVSATCNFLQQLHAPGDLEVGVGVSRIGSSSFTLDYGIFRRDGEQPVADASSVVVWVDYAAGHSVTLPSELRQRIFEIDGVV